MGLSDARSSSPAAVYRTDPTVSCCSTVDKAAVIRRDSEHARSAWRRDCNEAGRGFTSNGGDSTVTVFDTKTLKERTRIKVGKRPDGILYDAESGHLFTFNAQRRRWRPPSIRSGNGRRHDSARRQAGICRRRWSRACLRQHRRQNELLELDSRKLTVLPPLATGRRAKNRRAWRWICSDGGCFARATMKKMIVLNADNGKVLETLPIGQHTDCLRLRSRHRVGLQFERRRHIDRRSHRCSGPLRGAEIVQTQMGAPHDGP